MYRTCTILAALSLAAVAQPGRSAPSPVSLKEERLTLEYTATNGEAAVVMSAESESLLARVEIRDPRGTRVLDLRGEEGKRLALSGFEVESRESSPAELLETFAEGVYDLRARTVDGELLVGSAYLSHELPRAPTVTHPLEGSRDVPAEDLVVTWMPDPHAVAYQVVLEQNENDGLSARLPAGRTSLRVPAGVLAPGTASHVEVGAVGPSGNCTLVEVSFTTR